MPVPGVMISVRRSFFQTNGVAQLLFSFLSRRQVECAAGIRHVDADDAGEGELAAQRGRGEDQEC